ncbi:MAG: ABC transporter permease subunit [Verrucomicrobiota bacterium]
MILLPIVDRELRMAARRWRTYYTRVTMAGITALLGGQMLLLAQIIPGRSDGKPIFAAVATCLCVWAVISGLASCDAISKEKREGTIGLLFLTDLKGYDVVLGKLIASGVPSFYAALAALPVLALSIFLGGVTAVQFWETSLAVLNLFFFSYAAAMLGSAWFRDQKNAAGFSGLILFFYLSGLTILSTLANAYHWRRADLYQLFNPAHTVSIALSAGSRFRGVLPYVLSLAAVHLNGWLFLALASFTLPHRWQEKPRTPKRLRIWFEQLRFGTVAAQAAFRRRLLGINPFFWLVSRRGVGPATTWAVFGIFGVVIAGIRILSAREGNGWREDYPPSFVIAVVGFHLILKLGIANVAGGFFEAQRRNGSLETVLCCTPLSVSEILAGQWLVLRRLFLWPAVAVMALGLVTVAEAWRLGGPRHENGGLIYFILTATTMLAPDMIALAWMAMWRGMALPKAQGGPVSAVISVCVVPWLVIGAIIATLLALGVLEEPIQPWVLWLIIGLGLDVALCKIARRQLQKNFRRWAVPMSDSRLSLWGRLGRFFGTTLHNIRSRRAL